MMFSPVDGFGRARTKPEWCALSALATFSPARKRGCIWQAGLVNNRQQFFFAIRRPCLTAEDT